MANKRIQDLEQTTNLTNDDLLPLDTTKKTFAITLKSLVEWLKKTFQTTANIEQALSDATDKYPSSKTLKDESRRIVSVMDNYVKKSGDTMTGSFILKKNIPIQYFQDTTLDLSQKFTTVKDHVYIVEVDKNFKQGSHIKFLNDQYDNNKVSIFATNGVDPNRKFNEIALWVDKNGSGGTYARQCNFDNSIVTTVSHSNRYVRFGNGLQICWGAGSGVQTFQQPFRDTDYMITDSDLTYHKYEGMWTTDKTTTQFKINNSGSAQWIAIGWWY